MLYHLDFTDTALEEINQYKKSGDKVILKKLLVIFNELTVHLFSGAYINIQNFTPLIK